jgi:predicted DNA-binding transcriptional regulator AlpA
MSAERAVRPMPTAADLLSEPSRAWELTVEQARALLPATAALVEVLRVRAHAEPSSQASVEPPQRQGNRLLTVQEAAAKLGVTVKQLYNRPGLPFVVRLEGPDGKGKLLRYSERGIEQYIQERIERGID